VVPASKSEFEREMLYVDEDPIDYRYEVTSLKDDVTLDMVWQREGAYIPNP